MCVCTLLYTTCIRLLASGVVVVVFFISLSFLVTFSRLLHHILLFMYICVSSFVLVCLSIFSDDLIAV